MLTDEIEALASARGLEISRRFLSGLLTVTIGHLLCSSAVLNASSLAFVANQPEDYDYGHLLLIPPTFGSVEFTFEIWIALDDAFPVGSTASGEGQRLNWSDADVEPYSSNSWWYEGNFLLDGHNNLFFRDGTFSLQFYGGGRLRWLFGDGTVAGPGGHWSVGAYPADAVPSLLDGQWHHVALVRRFANGGGSDLELWVDGVLAAAEFSPARTDMRVYWDNWTGFPSGQEGWFLGAEKQAAIGILSQYEDFKGLVAEFRFFDRAKTASEISTTWSEPASAGASGLVGLFRVSEGMGVVTCDVLAPTRCVDLVNMKAGFWSSEGPPLPEVLFEDGFESGDAGAWTMVYE